MTFDEQLLDAAWGLGADRRRLLREQFAGRGNDFRDCLQRRRLYLYSERWARLFRGDRRA